MARLTDVRKPRRRASVKPAAGKSRPKLKKEGDDKARINFEIAQDLHREFKAKAAARGKTIKEVLEGAIQNFVARP